MSFVGSKGQAGVFQTIIGQMPPHEVYCEAFFGLGRVFWEKRPASRSFIIDQRPELLTEAAKREDVHAICGDAISIVPTLTLLPGDLVYCDPPYLLSTRKGRKYYQHELTDEQHASLLTMLQALKCYVLLSGYPSDLYGTALQGWRCLEYTTRTRQKTITECLWANFPEPQKLHDWRYAGKNYRQRLTLKRLAARWLARLDAMPALKRGYILNSIAQRQIRR